MGADWDGLTGIRTPACAVGWALPRERAASKSHVDVAYGTNPDEVIDVLRGALANQEGLVEQPEPRVLFMGFGESSLDFVLGAWVADHDIFPQGPQQDRARGQPRPRTARDRDPLPATRPPPASMFPEAYTLSGDGTLESVALNGSVHYLTVRRLEGFGIEYPSAGELLVTGADGCSARVIALDSLTVRLEIDEDGDGATDTMIDTTWEELDI